MSVSNSSESAAVISAHGCSRYQTLDNVDGKQARRTGTSSGLGELFEYVEQLE
jgi:phosphatidylglycerophosphate synthase